MRYFVELRVKKNELFGLEKMVIENKVYFLLKFKFLV